MCTLCQQEKITDKEKDFQFSPFCCHRYHKKCIQKALKTISPECDEEKY